MKGARVWLRRVLICLAALCLVVATGAGLVHRELLDAGQFAEHADHVRTDPDVAAALGERITDEVLEADPDLVVIRPLIEAVVTGLVGSTAFSVPFRAAVTPLYGALTGETSDDLLLVLADIGAVLVSVISAVAPEAAARLPADFQVRMSEIHGNSLDGRLVHFAGTTSVLAWSLPLVAALLLTVAAACTAKRRRGRVFMRLLGTSLFISAGMSAAVLLVLGVAAGREDRGTLRGAVTAAAWAELRTPAWGTAAVVAALGYALTATATPAGLANLRPRALATRVSRWATARPASPREATARSVLLVGVAGLLIAGPTSLVRLAGAFVGVLLLVEGLFLAAARMRVLVPAVRAALSRSPEVPARIVLAFAVSLLVLLVVIASWPASNRLPTVAGQEGVQARVCNGHVALCGRRYDRVAFPATHNSMSGADIPGWFFADQPTGVLGQLDDGIRAFLIDSWYGRPTERSGIVASPGITRKQAVRQGTKAFGATAVRSALRLAAAAGLRARGKVAPYLCHAMCELGSTKWEPLMEDVRRWLEEHPNEVITFIVQDQVSAADTATVFKNAGLVPYLHVQRSGRPWPTLEQMVESGKRVVVFMEQSAGDAASPWLMSAHAFIQDTPFDFESSSEFSCAPNRGRADAPLFLLNHWLSSRLARVSSAAAANAEDVLDQRVRRCERQRGHRPNFVAVDFYDQGDVFSVVDRINGF